MPHRFSAGSERERLLGLRSRPGWDRFLNTTVAVEPLGNGSETIGLRKGTGASDGKEWILYPPGREPGGSINSVSG
jgi:hypothetical protein